MVVMLRSYLTTSQALSFSMLKYLTYLGHIP